MKSAIPGYLRRLRSTSHYLRRHVLEVKDLHCLKLAMRWTDDPILGDPGNYLSSGLMNLNQRSLRDSEVLGAACRNCTGKTILEIGTAYGASTALMASNAPGATIHTVNMPPEESLDAGKYITYSLTRDQIGKVYREAGLTNVQQIYANTAHWEPDFGPIDMAFIDGCHDTRFVYEDTRKVLKKCRPGSLILWHDFNPALSHTYSHIGNVCRAVARLYADRLIRGKILHLRDSWVGLYCVPSQR